MLTDTLLVRSTLSKLKEEECFSHCTTYTNKLLHYSLYEWWFNVHVILKKRNTFMDSVNYK